MNWEAVGAISQIVGTVLVGITLIYLAIQLRQSTSALKSSTFLAISALMVPPWRSGLLTLISRRC